MAIDVLFELKFKNKSESNFIIAKLGSIVA